MRLDIRILGLIPPLAGRSRHPRLLLSKPPPTPYPTGLPHTHRKPIAPRTDIEPTRLDSRFLGLMPPGRSIFPTGPTNLPTTTSTSPHRLLLSTPPVNSIPHSISFALAPYTAFGAPPVHPALRTSLSLLSYLLFSYGIYKLNQTTSLGSRIRKFWVTEMPINFLSSSGNF